MRQNGMRFQHRLKGSVKKIFSTLQSNFDKAITNNFNTFCSSCMAWTKVREMEQILHNIFMSVKPKKHDIDSTRKY